jgi:hypothetical protein
MSSLDRDFGLLTSRPWNCNYHCLQHVCLIRFLEDFFEFETDGTKNFITPAISFDVKKQKGQKSFGFSILAEQVQILLTGGEQWVNNPGVIINLENNHEWMATCNKVSTDNDECPKVRNQVAFRYTHFILIFLIAVFHG